MHDNPSIVVLCSLNKRCDKLSDHNAYLELIKKGPSCCSRTAPSSSPEAIAAFIAEHSLDGKTLPVSAPLHCCNGRSNGDLSLRALGLRACDGEPVPQPRVDGAFLCVHGEAALAEQQRACLMQECHMQRLLLEPRTRRREQMSPRNQVGRTPPGGISIFLFTASWIAALSTFLSTVCNGEISTVWFATITGADWAHSSTTVGAFKTFWIAGISAKFSTVCNGGISAVLSFCAPETGRIRSTT